MNKGPDELALELAKKIVGLPETELDGEDERTLAEHVLRLIQEKREASRRALYDRHVRDHDATWEPKKCAYCVWEQANDTYPEVEAVPLGEIS